MKKFLSLSVLMVLISCGSSTTSQVPASNPSATTLTEEVSSTTTLELEQPTPEEQTNIGATVFGQNQILTVELEFSQNNFFEDLLKNHEFEEYITADLTITDASGVHVYENVGVRLKGNSSMDHPGEKKPLKIDFNRFISGQNHDGLQKLNFSNAFKDPSFLREKIFFDISRAAEVHAPRTNFANVYFNGELWGFYTVVEQIDDQFLNHNISDDTGNLFKAGSEGAADLQYWGTDQKDYERSYEIKNNEDANDWSDLITFIDFINNSSSEEFENDLNQYLATQDFLRSAALDNIFVNLDSYTLSGRNYYLYHNMETGLWEWIKWDGNEAFGVFAYGINQPLSELPATFADSRKVLLQRIFESEALTNRYLEETCFLIENFFNPTYMNEKIDVLSELIDNSVLEDPNKMYTYEEFITSLENDVAAEDPFIENYEPSGEIGSGLRPNGRGPNGGFTLGLKSFVEERHTYLTSALKCE